MKCKTCDQELPTPIILDALGREVLVTDFILWLRPVTRVDRDGISVSTVDGVLGSKPVMLYIKSTEWTTLDNRYCIDASVMGTCTSCPVDIRGEVGVPNMSIYRIARCITELDK